MGDKNINQQDLAHKLGKSKQYISRILNEKTNLTLDSLAHIACALDSVFYTDCMFFTKEMTASFFEIDTRTIERYITAYSDELKSNGYQILRGVRLKGFLNEYKKHFGTDINVGTKTTVLGVFSLRAFLDLAMMLSESENARVLRQVMLDIVIDLINKKTDGSTRFINQRVKDFVGSYLQKENYRKEFTDALCNYVDMGNFKYIRI